MQPVSFLDDLVNRFRHRWHTESQFRAMMSGIFAVVVLISLCTCAGIVSTITNNVFYGSGLAGGGGPSNTNGIPSGGVLQGFASFPIATLPAWTPGTIPNANPAPPSGTPEPTATPLPTPTPTATPTPCVSNCGGGGGPKATISITGFSPYPWKAGTVSVSIHTSIPNDGVNLLITNCTGGTVLNNGNGVTDGSGDYTFSFTQPGGIPSGAHASVTASEQTGGSTSSGVPCA